MNAQKRMRATAIFQADPLCPPPAYFLSSAIIRVYKRIYQKQSGERGLSDFLQAWGPWKGTGGQAGAYMKKASTISMAMSRNMPSSTMYVLLPVISSCIML